MVLSSRRLSLRSLQNNIHCGGGGRPWMLRKTSAILVLFGDEPQQKQKQCTAESTWVACSSRRVADIEKNLWPQFRNCKSF